MTDNEPTVYVIDDDSSVRKAMLRLLKSAAIRAESFASAEEFLAASLLDSPACIILDMCMPGLDGLALQAALKRRKLSLPIIFVTGHGDIPTTVRAMKAGAVDFLPKPFRGDDLLAAVRQALAKDALTKRADAKLAEIQALAESLSPRERQVMALVVSGKLNKQAGNDLGVTEKTVKVHRARVMEKMRAGSLAELVRLAQRLEIA